MWWFTCVKNHDLTGSEGVVAEQSPQEHIKHNILFYSFGLRKPFSEPKTIFW
jgi:hypothetical protein